MKRSIPKRNHPSLLTDVRGFSLIEVVLAVAIIALGLVAILGLLPGGIEASRTVSDETLLTQIVSDLLSERRVTPFDQDTLPLCSGCPGMPKLTALGTGNPLYFDASGNPTNVAAGAYFRLTPEVINHPDPALATASDLKRVVITAVWPLNPATGAPGSGANSKVFVGEFVRIP